ncbi:MAG: Mrp/NBP35 family ATP-binding protein [Alphaproteobacteria bacterium]|nr:Mrp/NBP35 family ATP-binding protein [Alphaproteobacteria bacterium]
MSEVTKDQVLEALRTVIDSDSGGDLVSLGWVTSVQVKNGHVTFVIEVPQQRVHEFEAHRKRAEEAVNDVPGVLSVTGILTAHNAAPHQCGTNPHQCNTRPAGAPDEGGPPGSEAMHGKLALPTIKNIIAVASGKGGVGKSTTAANLALAFSGLGLKVGLFDADIYGPSAPRMLGLRDARLESNADETKLLPLENHGIKCMSIGFMVPEDAPVIWRGPMVIGALEQLLRDVEWGEIDVLVVDLPPGTGDTQLTMCQRVPLAGAVIVSTPQDIALLDARKGLNMFRKVEVPVFGIIENMSYYICPKCGHRDEIFAYGGAQKTAEELNCDFLGEIPLDIKIRETADNGTPIVVFDPSSPHAQAYINIAKAVWDKVVKIHAAGSRQAPRLVVH